ncbi:MAG: ABC transporter ATP-binding protein [Rickettsiales bacterium]
MVEPFIAVRGVVKSFGHKKAVDGVSFSVNKGDVLGVLGPNGAGKTTTMRMLVGVLRPDAGDVAVCGHSLGSHRRRAQAHIGYLPEGAPLYGDLSPRLFLQFCGRARGMGKAVLKKRLEYVEERLHLGDVRHQAIDTLSKGYRRRVGLAQAILHDPDALILDEPTDGLDPMQKHDVRELISALSSEKAIVISTHILEEVDAVCTRAAVIAKGKMLFDGTPGEFIGRHPHHGAVRLLLGASAREEGVVERLKELAGVTRVERETDDKGRPEYWVFSSDAARTVSRVAGCAHDEKWEVRGVTVEKGSADEVFRSVVSKAA